MGGFHNLRLPQTVHRLIRPVVSVSVDSKLGGSKPSNVSTLMLMALAILETSHGALVVPKDVVKVEDESFDSILCQQLGTVKQTRKGIDAEFVPALSTYAEVVNSPHLRELVTYLKSGRKNCLTVKHRTVVNGSTQMGGLIATTIGCHNGKQHPMGILGFHNCRTHRKMIYQKFCIIGLLQVR